MNKNPVLESTQIITANSEHVNINNEVVDIVAKCFAADKISLPTWRWPPFPEADDDKALSFFFLGNLINAQFWQDNSPEEYTVMFGDRPMVRSDGMWAAIRNAYDVNIPLWDGKFLRDITDEKMDEIFMGNMPIPALVQRADIYREAGQVLASDYDGNFGNFVRECDGTLFGDEGFITKLVSEFESFDDRNDCGDWAYFYKRAQLLAGSLYTRFGEAGLFEASDVDELTVFADYQVPRTLNFFGILEYDEHLTGIIQSGEIIPEGSHEELEIRANTIHAAKRLQDKINEYRVGEPVNGMSVDYLLWMRRKSVPKSLKHHKTYTMRY